MSRESPPTRRVAQLLAAIVAAPRRAQSLAELCERTGISKPTALGILNELAVAGWLSRDAATKTYRPGPAMLGAGAAARQAFVTVAQAAPRFAALASQTGYPVTASAIVDGAVTVLARADSAGGTSAFQIGQRYPFAPPSGVMFVAWDDDQAVDGWLRQRPLTPLKADAVDLQAVVASCRDRGYLVVGLGELTAGLYALLDTVSDDQLASQLGRLLRETVPAGVQPYLVEKIRATGSYDVSLVCAPVLGPDGAMDYLVAVLIMQAAVSGRALTAVVEALTKTTAELTRQQQDPATR